MSLQGVCGRQKERERVRVREREIERIHILVCILARLGVAKCQKSFVRFSRSSHGTCHQLPVKSEIFWSFVILALTGIEYHRFLR